MAFFCSSQPRKHVESAVTVQLQQLLQQSQAFGSGSDHKVFRLRNPDVGLGLLRRSVIRSQICQDDRFFCSVPRFSDWFCGKV